jgi:hypothetical protein
MKIKLVFLCLIFFSKLFGQDEKIKLVSVDNSNFPIIEVIIKAEKNIRTEKISVFENKLPVDFTIDTIKEESRIDDRSILFVLDINLGNEIEKELIKNIFNLRENDFINIGYILKTDPDRNIIHFLSPDFSNNHIYFINYLESDLIKDFDYNLNKRNEKKALNFFDKMISGKNEKSNFGVIVLSKNLEVKPEPISGVLTETVGPVYIVLTEEPSKKAKEQMVKICIRSGGILTVSPENDISKTVSRYLDDISYQTGQKTLNILRIRFKTGQKQKRNFFNISYQKEVLEGAFNYPEKRTFSRLEIVLGGLAVFFLMLILILVYKSKKKIKEKPLQEIQPIGKNKSENPIEINVKTKGFNKTYFFEKHIISIGRSSGNDIIIPDRTVSGVHAVINKEGDSYMIQDMGSTNGVIIGQKKVKKQQLKLTEKIKLGGAILMIRY